MLKLIYIYKRKHISELAKKAEERNINQKVLIDKYLENLIRDSYNIRFNN